MTSVVLLVAICISGCGKRSESAAVKPTAPADIVEPTTNAATAGDCSSILQNVSAGGNISVNIKCDQPTESKIIDSISQGNWSSGCPIDVPINHFELILDSPSASAKAVPKPGNYFSQFDFRIEKRTRYFTESEFIFVHGDLYTFSDANNQMSNISEQMYAQILKFSEIAGGAGAISFEAAKVLTDETWPKKETDLEASFKSTINEILKDRLGAFNARRVLQLEDGKDYATENIGVYDEGNIVPTYKASIAVLPYINPYPHWSLDGNGQAESDMLHVEYTCLADKKIGIRTFERLCAILIERQLLSPKSIAQAFACKKPSANEEES